MLPGVLSVAVVPSEEIFYLRVWLIFIPFKINPIKMAMRGSQKKEKRNEKKKTLTEDIQGKSSKRSKGILKTFTEGAKFTRVLRAIHIKKMNLDIDTDDFLLNAWLVPVFSMANSHNNLQMRVNFEGNLLLDMDVRTRIGAILWILITNKIKKIIHFKF